MKLQDVKVFIDDTQRTVQRALDRITMTREDIRLQMRATRMQNLMLRGGTATSEELFIADFGTRNPNGLDITYPDHDQKVLPFEESLHYLRMSEKQQAVADRQIAGFGGDGGIALNQKFYKATEWKVANKQLSSTMAHEHIHCLQAADKDNGWDSSFSSFNTSVALAPLAGDSPMDKAKRLYQKAYQMVHETSKQLQSGNLTKIFSSSSDSYGVKNYLSRDVEMQARLHEILGQGYAVWQKMPATKVELWAALHNTGMEMPSSIKKVLNESEEGQQALKSFSISPLTRLKLSFDEVKELNEVYDYAALPERREMLMEHVYPQLYGNLLELYGDRLGRERMELGPNPRAAKEIMHQLLNDPENLTEEQVALAAAEMEPESAVLLLDRLAHATYQSYAQPAKAMNIIKQLMHNPEIKEYVNNMPDQTGIQITTHPLITAIREGNTTAIHGLLVNGADPLGSYSFEHASQPDIKWTVTVGTVLKLYNQLSEKSQSGESPEHQDDTNSKLYNLQHGLQALAEHTDKLDIEMPPGSGFGEGQSLKECLNQLGFTPKIQQQSAPSGKVGLSTP